MTAFAVEAALLLALVFLLALAVGYRLGRSRRPSPPAEAPPQQSPAQVEAPPPPAEPAPPPVPPIPIEPAASPQQDLFARLGIADMNAVPPLDEEEEDEPPPIAPPPQRPTPRRRPPESLPGTRPPALDAPEGEGADDLKLLKGIGPQNEQRLNEIGIFHLRQIAAWTPEEASWVGGYLAFPGRIEREDWIGQAKAILEGGAPPPRRRR